MAIRQATSPQHKLNSVDKILMQFIRSRLPRRRTLYYLRILSKQLIRFYDRNVNNRHNLHGIRPVHLPSIDRTIRSMHNVLHLTRYRNPYNIQPRCTKLTYIKCTHYFGDMQFLRWVCFWVFSEIGCFYAWGMDWADYFANIE